MRIERFRCIKPHLVEPLLSRERLCQRDAVQARPADQQAKRCGKIGGPWNTDPTDYCFPGFSTETATASVYVISTRSPTATRSRLRGSRALIVVALPVGPCSVTVPAALSMLVMVATTVVTRAPAPAGFSPGFARAASSVTVAPAVVVPGFFTS